MEEIKQWWRSWKNGGMVESTSRFHVAGTGGQVHEVIEQIRVELMEDPCWHSRGRGRDGGGTVRVWREMGPFRAYRKRWVTTREGAIRVRRAYYTCEHCGAGFFPPGSAVGDERGME